LPSQQRFEGPDLEVLLDDVRDRFGPDVAIVEANRVRKGGVGGFFAREVYEVVVESDDAVTPPPAERPRSLLDLVDAVQDGPAAPTSTQPQFYDVERRGDLDQPVRPSAAAMSSEGAAFADVLDRIARATAAPEPQVAAAPASSPATAPTAPAPDVDEPFRSFADIAPTARRPEPEPVRHRAPEVDRAALARLGLPGRLVRKAPTDLDRLSTLLHLAEAFPRARELPSTPGTVIALVGDRGGMERAVTWVHEQLGLAPNRLMLASRSETRVFPAGRRMSSPQEAGELGRSWRRVGVPTLVVVDDPVGIRTTSWARHVLDALEPSAVWAVVDAQRKPEDVVAWAERIGGVDAIALDGTDQTASPAAIVGTGVPVGLIDGHAASPARWAAVLDERLVAA
jgi:hypothetical protein